MRKNNYFFAAIAAMFILMVAGASVRADSITYTAFTTQNPANGTTAPFSASAQFTVSPAGTLTIVLTNNSPHTVSAGELIRSLSFKVSSVTTGSLTSSLGSERDVASDGTFTDSALATTDWTLSAGTTFLLSATTPDRLVIGDPESGGIYSLANSSIAGNGPHNPFLHNSPTFTITGMAGLTSVNQLSNVLFGFNTDNSTTPGTPHITLVPLPQAAWLGFVLVGGIVGGRKLRSSRNAQLA
jgi:hypothetical protein